MHLRVQQTKCAGKTFWIVKNLDHGRGCYHGPFEDENAAHDFVRSENWKELLREARAAKKARKAAQEEALAA